MAKLFVFGIGGTGSRVLRSLTMLLASGVKVGVDKIVPIIIDPDEANADLTRTVTLMDLYQNISNSLHYGAPKDRDQEADEREFFFHTGIEKVSQEAGYKLQIKDTADKTFEEFIGLPSMSKANQAITRMLFSDANLSSSMRVGFKGNPNMGSVVLNQIDGSDDYIDFANSFSQGDKIFIVSSIFGGTGASGFPLLLKTLRKDENNNNDQRPCPNQALLNSAPIGAISILPYFKLEQEETSSIDSSTFLSKTRSALSYYEKALKSDRGGTRGLDALYFLADEARKTYENNEGGELQKNKAHLIEMLAATAIVDFSNYEINEDNRTTQYYELGVRDTGRSDITFHTFWDELQKMLYGPLVRFRMMANALTDSYKDIYSTNRVDANRRHFLGIHDSRFMRDLRDFLTRYKDWTDEMKANDRTLMLFESNCKSNPFELVSEVKPKKELLSLKKNHELIIDRLNGTASKCTSREPESKYLEMFYRVTKELVNKRLTL